MPALGVQFYTPSGHHWLGGDRLVFQPVRYSHRAQGGPEAAEIAVRGDREALFGLLGLLGSEGRLLNPEGDPVWWGFVEALDLHVGAVSFGVSLEPMANAIKVTYAEGGQYYETDWVLDADSVATYGRKEALVSLGEMPAELAAGWQAVLLAQSGAPVPTVQSLGGGGGSPTEATMHLRGWYDTLSWRYYQDLRGQEANLGASNMGHALGEGTGITRLAQSFQIAASTAWSASSVAIVAQQVTDADGVGPTDLLVLEVCADNAGAPGTVLATVSVAGSALGTSPAWQEFTLPTPLALQPATTYWLQVSRSGANDATYYYRVQVDTSGSYPRGAGFRCQTDTWYDLLAPGDLIFAVQGTLETTQQVADCVAAAGEPGPSGGRLAGARILDASGAQSVPYRDGRTTSRDVVEALLEAGTAAGRRLLCRVDDARYLEVYAEPDYSPTYQLTADGRLWHYLLGQPLDYWCPAGEWVTLKDVLPLPHSISPSAGSRLDRFFIERAEYDVKNHALTFQPRGATPWTLRGTDNR